MLFCVSGYVRMSEGALSFFLYIPSASLVDALKREVVDSCVCIVCFICLVCYVYTVCMIYCGLRLSCLSPSCRRRIRRRATLLIYNFSEAGGHSSQLTRHTHVLWMKVAPGPIDKLASSVHHHITYRKSPSAPAILYPYSGASDCLT